MITKPVRKIGKSHRSITGKHVSRKTGTIHRFESALERDHLIILEFNDEVSHYVTQPLTIYYEHENDYLRYTPDVMVYYNDHLKRKPLLYEVKYEAELIEKQTEYAAKFNAADKYAADNGYEFQTITEKQIRTIYLDNIKLLSRYHHQPINEHYVSYICRLLTGESFLEIEAVVGTETNRPYILHTVWQMLALKRLGCNMNTKLTMNTLIWNL
jgi:hypothetical protein